MYFSYTGFRSSKLDNLKRPLLMQGEWLKSECMHGNVESRPRESKATVRCACLRQAVS